MAGEIKFKKIIEAKPMVGDYIISKENEDIFRIIYKWQKKSAEYYLLNEKTGHIEEFSKSDSIDNLLFDIDYKRVIKNENTILEEK